jgi:N-acetylglutamate synthase-like GNAT family acetyltransferase
MMRIEYLIDRKELIPDLARITILEWFYLRPMVTQEAQIAILRQYCGHRQIPTILVATSGDEILGSAALVAHGPKSLKSLSPWLDCVLVKPTYRRQGIATSLINRIEEEAFALGISCLYLSTINAEVFYSHLGWQYMERCAYQGIMVSVMKKNVSAQPVAPPNPGRSGPRVR